MPGVAQARARQLGRTVDLRQADARALPFPDARFDTVVCTFALCAIPGERCTVGEMIRVLRPAGLLLLADHIAGATWPVRAVPRAAQVVTVSLQGEHMLRRPSRPKGCRSSGASGSSSGSWNGLPPANPPLDSGPGWGAHPAAPSQARIAEFLPVLLDLRDSAGRNRGGERYL